jgi:membrane protease YdiL (CAAX protease family)
VSTSPAPNPPSPQGWPLWTAFGGLLGGWLGGSVLGAVVYAIAAANGHDPGDAPLGYDLAANLLLDACLIGAAVGFARLAGRVTPASFGLRGTPLGRALLWGIVGYVAYLVISALWLGVTNAHNEQDDITTTLKDHPTTATVAGLAIFAVVIAPIVEEVFFRGFVFTAMRAKLNVWIAAIVSGAMFGVVHAFGSPWQFLVPLSVLGTVLCIVYWKTGSLYPCIALHAINNSVALSTALDWTWQIPLLMGGSLTVITAILLPVVRLGGGRPAPA